MHNTEPSLKIKQAREGEQELTLTGIRNHYFLGKLFKNKFSDLFKYSMPETSIVVSSTERTIASAMSNYTGFTESNGQSILETPSNPELWTPPGVLKPVDFKFTTWARFKTYVFPYDMQNANDNFIFWTSKICPKIKPKTSDHYQNKINQFENKFIASIQMFERNGYDIKSFYKDRKTLVEKLFGFLDVYVSKMFSDPSLTWTYETRLHTEVIHSIKEIAKFDDNELNIQYNYYLYKDWINQIDKFLKKTQDSDFNGKLALYSAHDSNVAMVLAELFGFNDLNCMLNQYEKYVKNSIVKNESDYKAIINKIKESGCFHFIPFASNLSFEVFSQKQVLSFNKFD
jgi:hypothetical protein